MRGERRGGSRPERPGAGDGARRERASGSRIRLGDAGRTWPDIPEWVDRGELGRDVLADLRGLSKPGAEFVAGHLVAAGALAEDDPDAAWEHARAARSQGGRIAVVRETVGLVAYRAGHWAEAISELRAARRMTGGPGQLAVMADAERALGHPERAIELARTAEAAHLDPASAAELQIVVAGARADLGQDDAAIASLLAAVRDVDPDAPHAFRLYYAYAALLERVGRRSEALTWFVRAADADADDESDAPERARALTDDGSPSGPSGPNGERGRNGGPAGTSRTGRGSAADASDGQASDGEASDGEQSDGEASDGEQSDGRASDGEQSHGEVSDGGPSSGARS